MPYTASGSKAEWSTDGVTFTEVPEVRTWGLNPTTEPKTYRSSSTNGAQRRLGGDDDHAGSLSVYIDGATRFDTDLGIKRGVSGTLRLYETETIFWVVPVFITDVDYEADIEGNEIIGAEVSFESDGVLQYPT